MEPQVCLIPEHARAQAPFSCESAGNAVRSKPDTARVTRPICPADELLAAEWKPALYAEDLTRRRAAPAEQAVQLAAVLAGGILRAGCRQRLHSHRARPEQVAGQQAAEAPAQRLREGRRS